MLDWLIVGGGIHGVHIASRLVRHGVPVESLRIVDPAPRLLHQWHRCTEVTGMAYLRSPLVHHLDNNPFSLRRFADTWAGATRPMFRAPYDRPSMELFAAHAAHVIERDGLAGVHVCDRVVGVDLSCSAADVHLASGDRLAVGRVLLAIGASEQPHRPAWADDLVDCCGGRVGGRRHPVGRPGDHGGCPAVRDAAPWSPGAGSQRTDPRGRLPRAGRDVLQSEWGGGLSRRAAARTLVRTSPDSGFF